MGKEILGWLMMAVIGIFCALGVAVVAARDWWRQDRIEAVCILAFALMVLAGVMA